MLHDKKIAQQRRAMLRVMATRKKSPRSMGRD
jgi:hypothetical protein